MFVGAWWHAASRSTLLGDLGVSLPRLVLPGVATVSHPSYQSRSADGYGDVDCLLQSPGNCFRINRLRDKCFGELPLSWCSCLASQIGRNWLNNVLFRDSDDGPVIFLTSKIYEDLLLVGATCQTDSR